MMQETLLTGTAHKAELPGWQAAGKTGTSQDFRDAWFIGYTSYLVAAVWLGNDDDSPTKKVSGGNLPVEVWSRFMKEAHDGVPVAALPLSNWRAAAAPGNPLSSLLAPFNLPGAAPRGARPTPLRAAAAEDGRPRSRPAPLRLRPGRRPPGAAIPPTSRPAPGPDIDSAPVPPAPIPNVGGQPGQRANDFLNKIFGRLSGAG